MNISVPPPVRFPRFQGRMQPFQTPPPPLSPDAHSAAVLLEIVEQ